MTPNTTEEEKKEILGVAEYPQDDLHDQTCGTPPDRDFSTAKPSNQTNFSVFSNYVEPYIRPLTEEDIAFLKERVRLIRCRAWCLTKNANIDNFRVIESRLSSCRGKGHVTIERYGPKKTAQ